MPKRISEKELFKTKIFTIKELEIELDSGKKITRQILDKGDTSLIVPINIGSDDCGVVFGEKISSQALKRTVLCSPLVLACSLSFCHF